MDFVLATFLTINFTLKLLRLMELHQALVKSRIIHLVNNVRFGGFPCRSMLNDLIRDGVVTVGEDLTVPLNGQEGLVDEILIKVRRIVG